MTQENQPLRKYLRRPQAALYLGVAVQTLANWHVQGRGPRVTKLGRLCVYAIADLDAFAERQDALSTSERRELVSA
jgi:hypothetical protein